MITFVLPRHGFVLLEVIGFSNKKRVTFGSEVRLIVNLSVAENKLLLQFSKVIKCETCKKMVHYFNVNRWVWGRCIGGHWLENPLTDDAKAGSTQKSWQTRKKVGLNVWRLKDDLLIHQPDRFQQKVAQYKHNGYHDHAIKITVHDVWRNNCLLLQKSCNLKKT